ncbi:MAG: response regulator transcription factor [Lachnospiraceae bacterium]|nr:response regulator transcription factor [Lachnospiraceae bacterium]
MIEIYYVEDDEVIAQAVADYLGQYGYKVTVYEEIESAKGALNNMCPTLMLVDWNMPDGNGNQLVRWIRAKWKELPVIFLTVRGDSSDIVSGFQNGADDYVVKPFELDVLLSRIKALLRRTGDVSKQYLSCGAISIDQARRIVFYDKEEISLSPSEYQLLLYLMRNKGRTVTREKLLGEIWDNNGNYVNDNTLTVTMKRLREKLHQPAYIRTVRSIGYRMENEE